MEAPQAKLMKYPACQDLLRMRIRQIARLLVAARAPMVPLVLLCPSLLMAGTCEIQTESSFFGEVVDADGHPVRGASVTIFEGSKLDLPPLISDADGKVCWGHLPAGRHRLLVVAEGFSVLDAELTKATDQRLSARLELTPAFGEELVVTGTRTAKRLVEVPVHVQQIPRAHIEAASARTLADAIELTPGIRIESNCQSCNFSQVRMMGLEGPYSQILVDGQPTVSSLAMVYGIEQFPARMLDSIEIVKGGGAAIYGGGAVGGVINLISHAPSDTHSTVEARFTELGGEGGYSVSALSDWSPRFRQAGLSILAQIDAIDPVDRNGDGLTEVARRRLNTVGLRGEHYVFASAARWSGEVNYTDADRRGGDLDRLDLPAHRAALTEEILTSRLGAGIGWLHQVSPKFDYRLATSYSGTSRDSYYGVDFDPNAYGKTDNPLWIFDSQANFYRDRGTITGGVQYNRDTLDDFQPGYGRQISATFTNLAGFIQEDRKLGSRTTLVYGLRADQHSELDDPVVSPRLALMWTPKSDVSVRVSLAEGFRPPMVFDEDLHIELAGGAARVVRPSPDLVQETSRAYLASLEWRPTFARKGSASFELAVFQTDLQDLFHVIDADDPTTPEQEERLRINFGGARVAGLEFSASVRWGSRLNAQLGFVEQSSRFNQPEPDFGVRDFFRTPQQHGTLSLQIRLPAELDLFLGARYTGSMVAPHYAGFIAEDRLETTRSFFEVDLNVGRTFEFSGRSLTLTVGGKNLTDAYQDDLDQGLLRDSNYVYGPRLPRSLSLGLRVEL